MDERLTRETALALSRKVLTPGFSFADAPPDLAALAQAIKELEETLPLNRQEPALDGPLARIIEDSLRPIGAKIDPRISAEQATAWRKAMLLALSDLPGTITLKATRKAIHRPMQFLNEAETIIRELAAEAMEQQRTALWRLKRWQADIERAANPQPAIEAPPSKPVTQEEVDETNAFLRGCGVTTRFRLEGEEAVMEVPPSEKRKSEVAENGQI